MSAINPGDWFGGEPVRLLLVADTHGQVDERIAALAGSCQAVVHAGDLGSDGVLEAFGACSVLAVTGNNDLPERGSGPPSNRIGRLPASLVLSLPGGHLVVTHGHQYPAHNRHHRLRSAHSDAGAIVYGHSHRLTVDDRTRPWVLNPGAAGRIRTYGGPSCLVLTATGHRWTVTPHRFAPARSRNGG